MRNTLNWIGFLTIGLSCFFLGLSFDTVLGNSTINAETASLIGAAMGAGITVLGSIWVAQFQVNRQYRAFSTLLIESVKSIWNSASLIAFQADQEEITNYRRHGFLLAKLIEQTKESFSLFEDNISDGQITDYEIKLKIYRLEKEIQDKIRIFDKEGRWLENPTQHVVENSKGDLMFASEGIINACEEALKEFGHNAKSMSVKEAETQLAHLTNSD